jgi:hypothetical protein
MMKRWGLEGMRSFEQVGVAKKEGINIMPAEANAPPAPLLDRI